MAFSLQDLLVPPLPTQDYGPWRGRDVPVVIDAGAWHMRAGWTGEELPARAFRSVLAKTRREAGVRQDEVLKGSGPAEHRAAGDCD